MLVLPCYAMDLKPKYYSLINNWFTIYFSPICYKNIQGSAVKETHKVNDLYTWINEVVLPLVLHLTHVQRILDVPYPFDYQLALPTQLLHAD